MGVPGFFAWLLKNYKNANVITSELLESVDNFYIDANCLFHPQCHKILNHYGNKLDLEKLENKMIKRILNFLDYLIAYVNPQKKVFISVDGVAPMAKMSQQRKRRYKSIYDNELKDDIKKKHNKETTTIWNNTTITPGTIFMEKLHTHLVDYIKQNRIKLNIDYTYSSYHTVGEGEHKILQDIKLESQNQLNNDDVYVVYGLDADLIFLSLASKKDKIYLLREETFFRSVNHFEKEEVIDIVKDVSEDLNYVSMDETKKCINDQMRYLINKKLDFDELENEFKYENVNIDTIDFIDDFIVICYFIGNDFIPNLPSIEIKNDGLDFLLDNYVNAYLTLQTGMTYIDENNNININTAFFDIYIESLAKFEDYYFRVKFPKFTENLKRRHCHSDDPFDKEIWNIDNMRSFKIDDPIKVGYDRPELWKFRYYEHYYGTIKYQKNHIHSMCNDYLKGIMWTIKYYFQKCESFDWQYKYYNAPFVSDLSQYLKETKIDVNELKFEQTQMITPFIQLLSVLPPSCHKLLPQKYGMLMNNDTSPIIDMFPINVELDMLYKDSFHKCIPLIPNINITRISNATQNIILTNNEKQRNLIIENLIVCHKK